MSIKSLFSRRIFFLLAFICLLIFPSCAFGENPENSRRLTVFAASSLSDAMDDLADLFESENPDVDVVRHYASSSHLAAQIIEGAQADVFASANEIQMDHLISVGLVGSEPQVFAVNRLTICLPAGNPAGIHSPLDLARPGISLILAAPDTPVRVYTDEMLALLGDDQFQAAVYFNLVSEEVNVRQVVAKIVLGEADAGVVYTSDITGDMVGLVEQVEIPYEFNPVAAYPVARLSEAREPELAQQFINFILGPEGQSILQSWGFGIIPTDGDQPE